MSPPTPIISSSSSSSYVHIHVGPVHPPSLPVSLPVPASSPASRPASLPLSSPASSAETRPRSRSHTHTPDHDYKPKPRPLALSLPAKSKNRPSLPSQSLQPRPLSRDTDRERERKEGEEALQPPRLDALEGASGSGSTLVGNAELGHVPVLLDSKPIGDKPEGTPVDDPSPTKDENDPTPLDQPTHPEFIQHTKDLGFLPIPRHLRFHPDRPFRFGWGLNVAFGVASTFIVSNLYYNQPLLIQLSSSFRVPLTRVSAVPALTQAGYAVGLVFISPCGDLVARRPLILLTVTLSTLLTIGLCTARDVRVFEGVSFAVGVCTVTPQILIPLAADLAPPSRRASAISVVLSGLLFGILIARVLSGVIAEYVSWRVVYYFALSVQSLVLVGAYFLLPAYPAKNSGVGGGGGGERMTYFGVLKSMAHFAHTEPLLVQCTLVNLASAAAFSNFWVTLTFLLGGEGYGYGYSTLVIGLFGLVGMAGVAFGPVVGYVIDRLVPWYASLFAVLGSLLFQTLYAAAGTKSVAAVVVACFGLDVFRQMLQVSLTTAAFSISTAARARLNAILILGIFVGQVTGTALGSYVFLNHGFLPNAGLNLGLGGVQLLLLGIRGPGLGRYGWFGWAKTREGWEWRRAKAANHVLPGGVDHDTSISLAHPRGVRPPPPPAHDQSPLSSSFAPKSEERQEKQTQQEQKEKVGIAKDGEKEKGEVRLGGDLPATDSHPRRLLAVSPNRNGGEGRTASGKSAPALSVSKDGGGDGDDGGVVGEMGEVPGLK